MRMLLTQIANLVQNPWWSRLLQLLEINVTMVSIRLSFHSVAKT